MKTKLFIITLSAILAFSVFFSSCEAPKNKVETNSYVAGGMISELILGVYLQANNDLNYASAYQQDLAQILSGDYNNNIDIKPLSLVDNFDTKINLFSAYRDFMIKMQEQNLMPDQSVESSILAVLDYVDSLNMDEYTQKSHEIRDYIAGYKYDINTANYEISNIVFDIFDTDVLFWISELNKAYITYAATVDSIPVDVFDQDKLEKFVYEPYKDKQTLVNVYKLNMKQDAYERKTIFIDKATRIKTTFSRLRTVYLNIANNDDNDDIDYYLIEQILNELKNYNTNE